MRKWLPEVLVLLFEGAVAVGFFVLGKVSFTDLAAKEVNRLAAVVLVMITILIVYAGLRFAASTRRLDSAAATLSTGVSTLTNIEERLRLRVPTLVIYRQDQFYEEFGKSVRAAQHAVTISHLDSRSPLETATSAAGQYYRSFPRIIRDLSHVSFRRLERQTVGKRDWLKKLCSDFNGATNFSLALLRVGGTTKEKIPIISVQIVDTKLTYLVAVSTHDEPHQYRDLLLTGEEPARIWQAYYDSLWHESRLLINRGVVDADLLREALGE